MPVRRVEPFLLLFFVFFTTEEEAILAAVGGAMLWNRGVCHLSCQPKCPNTHMVMGAGSPHPGNWGLVISAQQK